MTRIALQVSRAIRILRGNRDESARASHLVAKKAFIVNNDAVLVGQAEREKFFQSTFFERKIMSTKTAFKRIALVAAAALAIGGVSAVSAQATTYAAGPDWSISNSYGAVGATTATETATQIAGVANFVTLTPTSTVQAVTLPATYNGIYYTITGGTTISGTTSGTTLGAGTVNIATPTVGTVTVTSYVILGGAAASTASSTVTITVVASIPGTVYAASTVFGNTAATSFPITADGTFPLTASAISAASAANFTLVENDANAVNLTTGYYKSITATVTNGLLTSTGGLAQGPTTYISGIPTAAATNFVLSSIAGLPGNATVTFSVNGVVVKTYAVVFTGAAVKVVATAVNSVIGIGAGVVSPAAGVYANIGAIKIQEFDANGVAIAANALTLVSSDTTKVSATTAYGTPGTTSVTANLTGVAAGTSSITFTDGALTSNAVPIRVSSGVPTSVVLTTDAAAYAAGQSGTLSLTLSDAAGPLAAGAYSVYTAAPTASFALTVGSTGLQGLAPLLTVNNAGVATVAFNAPLADGTTTISGTTSATTIVETPVSFSVSSGASDAANAATDAANEATDAANAATDAANAAADSADAATQAAMDAGDKADAALAAVTALSQQVTSVLAKVAALSALLVRIVKKVKA